MPPKEACVEMFTLLHRETGELVAELDERGLQEHCGLQLVHRHDGELLRNVGAPARVVLLSEDTDMPIPIAAARAIQPGVLIDVGPYLIRYHAEPNGTGTLAPPEVARHSIRVATSRRRRFRKKAPYIPLITSTPVDP